MVLRPGASHYVPIGRDAAFELIADELRALDSPQHAANLLLLQGMIGNPVPGCARFVATPTPRVTGPDHGNLGEDARVFPGSTGRRVRNHQPPGARPRCVDIIRAMRDGRVSVFMAMGGNFISATPDTVVTEPRWVTVR